MPNKDEDLKGITRRHYVKQAGFGIGGNALSSNLEAILLIQSARAATA